MKCAPELTHCSLVMAYGDIYLGQHWLIAPRHYLNHCWHIRGVLWHSHQSNFIVSAHALNPWYVLRYDVFIITVVPHLPRVNEYDSLPVHTQSHSLHVLHVWDDIEEELLSQFGFSRDHESLKTRAVSLDELRDGLFCQPHRVADVQGFEVLKLMHATQLLQNL